MTPAEAGQWSVWGILFVVGMCVFYRWAVRGATQEELDQDWERWMVANTHRNTISGVLSSPRLRLVEDDEPSAFALDYPHVQGNVS